MTTFKTFGQLTIGTVVNYTNNVIASNIDYVVLLQYTDKFGSFTKVLNKVTNEIDEFTQHTEIKGMWSIVKENQSSKDIKDVIKTYTLTTAELDNLLDKAREMTINGSGITFDYTNNEIIRGIVCICKDRQDQYLKDGVWICCECDREIKSTKTGYVLADNTNETLRVRPVKKIRRK